MRRILTAIVIAAGALWLTTAMATPLFSNGFETDTHGWNVFGGSLDANRVPSGTNGITSSSGSWHAQNSAPNGAAGNWGGYGFNPGCTATSCASATFPEGGYTTSTDIYLDVSGGWANNTRFDFDSAIGQQDGTFLRDFIFNAGYYTDGTGPGANTNRFVISASTNSQPGSAYAKDPTKDPFAISATGWYTFQNRFYDDGGTLAVDMSIEDASDNVLHTWTLSDPADLISIVGGNRYGWFDYNDFSTLAFDNTSLTLNAQAVPEPSALGIFGFGLIGLAFTLLKQRRAKTDG